MNELNKIRDYNWGGKTILIVENNDSCLYLLEELFHDTHAEIIHTSLGLEGIDFCMRNNIKIDLIITSMRLPDISGSSLAKAVKSFSKVPIVAYTATMENKQNKKNAEFDDYLLKPINLMAAKAIVNYQLSKKTHKK